jgi:hypothetical protein
MIYLLLPLLLLFTVDALNFLQQMCSDPCNLTSKELSRNNNSKGTFVNHKGKTMAWHRLECNASNVELQVQWVKDKYSKRGAGLEFVIRAFVFDAQNISNVFFNLVEHEPTLVDFYGFDWLYFNIVDSDDTKKRFLKHYSQLLDVCKERRGGESACLNTPQIIQVYQQMESASPSKKSTKEGWWLSKKENVARIAQLLDPLPKAAFIYVGWRREIPVWQVEPPKAYSQCAIEADLPTDDSVHEEF